MNRRFLGAPACAGAFVLVTVMLCAAGLSAQAVAVAEIDGVVTDASGKVVPGAQVIATEIDKHLIRQTTSGAEGRFSLPDLPIGPYTLEVKAPGFKDYRQTGIELRTAQNTEINIQLTVGAVTESVEVVANAAMVETKDAALGQVMDQRKIEELPLNGRNPISLITLTGAGTQDTPSGGDLTGSKNIQGSNGSVTYSIGGSQANGISFLLDGGDNNDSFSNVNMPIPVPDMLAEFNVQANALQAQYGLHPGAVVNIVTKSGSNAFHGDLFDYLRNYELNARPKGLVQTNAAGAITSNLQTGRDSLKRNQYGGVAGGRIIRDKLFFFAGYQQTTQRLTPTTTTAHVPTALTLAGNFQVEDAATSTGGCQSKAITLKDPLTGLAFPNQTIPSTRMDPASMNLLKNYIPVSTDNCGVFFYGQLANNPDWQLISRIDFVKSDKHDMYARWYTYNYTALTFFDGKNALTTGPNPGNKDETNSITFGDTYTVSPTQVNSFHATWNRRADNRGAPPNLFGPNTLGIKPFAENMPDNYIQISVSNYFNVACGTCAPGYFNINTYQLSDDYQMTKGRHQLSFGFDFRKQQFNSTNNQQSNGQWAFGTAETGDGLGDTEIGALSSLTDGNALSDYMRQTVFAAYAQDSWRITPHLTINYGLRWEPLQPAVDKQCRGNQVSVAAFLSGFHSAQYPAAPAGLLFGNDGLNKNGCQFADSHWLDVSPRFGAVWDPFGDGKTSIRMGVALMHDSTELFYPERWTTNPPYASSVSLGQGKGIGAPGAQGISGPFSNPWLGVPCGEPFPGAATFPLSSAYVSIPPDVPATYLMNWTMSIQHQFAKDWLASITYLGNHSVHLYGQYDLNVALPVANPNSTNENSSNEPQRRTLALLNPAQGAYYAVVGQTDPGGTSFYNAILGKVEKRFSTHYTILMNYTYSHCISNVDFTGELTGNAYQNPHDRRAETSNCASDRRQIFNTSLVASSPGFGHGFAKQLTKDWQVAPLITLQSGSPLTVTDGADVSLSGEGTGSDRPNVVPGVSLYPSNRSLTAWFNTGLNGTPAVFSAGCNVASPPGFSAPAAGANFYAPLSTNPYCVPLGTFGNATRNLLFGPGTIQWDMSITRQFVMKERYKLDLRAEFFNFMNHANWNNPTTGMTSANYGQITGFGGPRLIEMALKLHF